MSGPKQNPLAGAKAPCFSGLLGRLVQARRGTEVTGLYLGLFHRNGASHTVYPETRNWSSPSAVPGPWRAPGNVSISANSTSATTAAAAASNRHPAPSVIPIVMYRILPGPIFSPSISKLMAMCQELKEMGFREVTPKLCTKSSEPLLSTNYRILF